MAKEITITLDTQGGIKVELSGYKGKECDQEKLLALLESLMADGSSSQRKPEYYQQQTQHIRQGS